MTMPHRFEELAEYNARIANGVVHTDNVDKHMAELQAEYDEWALQRLREKYPNHRVVAHGAGGYLLIPEGVEWPPGPNASP